MKKLLAILLIALIAISITGCGMSDEVIKKISELGEVSLTPNSCDAIDLVVEAYNSLPDNDKDKVSNYDELLEIEAKYIDLVIEKVSYDDKHTVSKALDAFEKYAKNNETVQNMITMSDRIEEIPTEYTEYVISQIGDPANYDIDNVRTAINTVNNYGKKDVSNIEELYNAIKAITEDKIENIDDFFTSQSSADTSFSEIRKMYNSLSEVEKNSINVANEWIDYYDTVVSRDYQNKHKINNLNKYKDALKRYEMVSTKEMTKQYAKELATIWVETYVQYPGGLLLRIKDAAKSNDNKVAQIGTVNISKTIDIGEEEYNSRTNITYVPCVVKGTFTSKDDYGMVISSQNKMEITLYTYENGDVDIHSIEVVD